MTTALKLEKAYTFDINQPLPYWLIGDDLFDRDSVRHRASVGLCASIQFGILTLEQVERVMELWQYDRIDSYVTFQRNIGLNLVRYTVLLLEVQKLAEELLQKE